MRSLILAAAVSCALLGPAAAETIVVYGPNGAITHVTTGVWGKGTIVVTPIQQPQPPIVVQPSTLPNR